MLRLSWSNEIKLNGGDDNRGQSRRFPVEATLRGASVPDQRSPAPPIKRDPPPNPVTRVSDMSGGRVDLIL